MIGIDIADSKRFSKLAQSEYSLWKKVFTKGEWQYCFEKPAPAQHLAGIFTAKEAVIKAFGVSSEVRLDCIEVIHDENGKPRVHISSHIQTGVEISISHDGGFAVAVAVQTK